MRMSFGACSLGVSCKNQASGSRTDSHLIISEGKFEVAQITSPLQSWQSRPKACTLPELPLAVPQAAMTNASLMDRHAMTSAPALVSLS